MPKKRHAEDATEQALTVKASKKRRVSGGEKSEQAQTGDLTATPIAPEVNTISGKKNKKKDKNDKPNVTAAGTITNTTAEDDATTAAAPISSSTKKSNGKEAVQDTEDDDENNSLADPPANGTVGAPSREEKARARKEKRRKEREQKLAKQLAEAQKEAEKKGKSDPEAQAQLKDLKSQHAKAKKHVDNFAKKQEKAKAKKAAASASTAANGAAHAQADIDALRREIRAELEQEMKQQDVVRRKQIRAELQREMKQQEEARKQKFKNNRQKKREAAKSGVKAAEEPQAGEEDAEETTEAAPENVELVEADVVDGAENDSQKDGRSNGLVLLPTSRGGSKPTSDSLQLAQMGVTLASVDASRFSKSLQDKLQKLQSMEWKLSTVAGGRNLTIDPIFSSDEQAIIIAYPSCVKVFSTKTSLLLRTLEIVQGNITDIELGSDQTKLFIGSTSGNVEQWNWNDGERLANRDFGSSVQSISVIRSKDDTSLSFTVQPTIKGKQWQMQLHDLETRDAITEPKIILRSPELINKPRVFDGGKFVIATSGRRIIVGILQSADDASLSSWEYLWHELDCPGDIACTDTYSIGSSQFDAHVAIGSDGPVYLYRNLVSQLQAIAKKKAKSRPSVQKLHWHRYPVETVKFSKDGNYLISGGFETVLCKWQLDTGKREDLPHMTAPVEGLVVSPKGASYAVTLGNNSTIILSTLDMEPSFAIAGPALSAVLDISNTDAQASKPYPASLRPKSSPPQIMLATPASSSAGSPTSAVYLQTVDVRTGTQLEKQALTRTNVTDTVSDPQGRILGEPDVTHLSASADGKWLAAVEDWRLPMSDLEFTADSNEIGLMSKSRRETYLKLWSRDEDSKTWCLSSRIDNPHGDGPLHAEKISDLATDNNGFVTVGGDGRIKVWRQQSRQRDGLQVKDKKGTVLTSWYCARTIASPPPPIVEGITDKLLASRLALSADSTLLVAVFKYKLSTVVRLINHIDGSVILSRSDLPVSVLIGVAVVDHYLVMLSESLTVWNIVQDRLQFNYRIRSSNHTAHLWKTYCHLAAHKSGSFAIAVPGENGRNSEVIIFDPTNSEPLAVRDVQALVRSLVTDVASRGFYIVDGLAQTRHLQAPQSATQIIQSLLSVPDPVSEDVAQDTTEQPSALQLFGLPLRRAQEEDNEDEAVVKRDDAQKALPDAQPGLVFTQDSLAEIFEGPGTTMSNFMKVAGLALRGRAAA